MKSISLIGAGYWGKNILRVLIELGVLHSVVEPSLQVIKERQKEFPSVSFFIDDSNIINNKEVKGVVIAAPSKLHYELTRRYLVAGKDVLVEKPLSLSVKQGKEIVELAKREGRILMVGHILQYHPAVLKIRDIIASGELGEINYIYSNRLNLGKIRGEENVLWSFAPHDISIILSFLGDLPIEIFSKGFCYLNKDIYDTILTFMRFKNGASAHIFVSWLHPFKEQKMVLIGSKKMLVFEDTSNEKIKIYPYKIIYKNRVPVTERAKYFTVETKDSEPLKCELMEFLDCIEKRRKPLTDGFEGLNVLKVLEAAEKSIFAESK